MRKIARPFSGLFIVKYIEGHPCSDAFPVNLMQVDCRNVDDPKKIPANDGTDGDWYKEGSNHRVKDGKIYRDLGWAEEWVVLLDDMMDFVDKYGRCLVDRDHRGFATIRIMQNKED